MKKWLNYFVTNSHYCCYKKGYKKDIHGMSFLLCVVSYYINAKICCFFTKEYLDFLENRSILNFGKNRGIKERE